MQERRHRSARRALESPEGGLYHDGRFASLRDVVDHYDRLRKLSFTEQEKRDLIEYLKSL
ncbi:MAG: hypothetical protein WEF99_07035 [Thermoanaerobaculia bacterium]